SVEQRNQQGGFIPIRARAQFVLNERQLPVGDRRSGCREFRRPSLGSARSERALIGVVDSRGPNRVSTLVYSNGAVERRQRPPVQWERRPPQHSRRAARFSIVHN